MVLVSETKLVRVPENTAVVQGTAVTLHCSSNVRRSWLHSLRWYSSVCVRYGNCQLTDLIFRGSNPGISVVTGRFNVTSVNNATHVTRDIIINPTRLTDAGVYLCAETVGKELTDTSSAQLIVIGMKTTYSRLKFKPPKIGPDW